MPIKRFVLAILLILIVCSAVALYVGSRQPFAPRPVAGDTEGANGQDQVGRLSLPASRAEVPTPTGTEASLPPADATRSALDKTAEPGTLSAQSDANLTQTAIPAQQTLDAIDARAKATWTPTAGPTGTLRAIDTTTNFLLLGSDLRPNDPTWVPATDVIMVLFLDTANRRAALLSFPRDLVVAIPGHFGFRINYVFQYGLKAHGVAGGAELVKQVLHDEFGLRIDHWALIDLNGFQKIIDTLGGIDVQVPCALEDSIDNQPFVIPAGLVHMDYATARRYVQSRYTTSDTSRNYRQQRVLWAILKKGIQLNAFDRVPTLWGQVHDAVQTDLTLFDLVGLVPAGYQLDPLKNTESIHGEVIEYPAVYPYVASDGAWLFMPNYDEIKDRLGHLFDAPQIARPKPDNAECPVRVVPTPTATPTATPTPQG